jgi:hypothetical protein
MLVKKKVLQTIRELPENFSIDELMERMILLEKIDNGLKQSEADKVISTAIAKKKLKKWL